MKEGWEITSLGDSLILMRNGINCKQKKDGLGSKVTRIQTIADGTVNPNKVGYANLTESENKKYRLKIGDVLFSHINSPIHVGKTAYVEKDYGLIHGMNLLCFRTSEEVDPKFLEYYLKNLYWSGFWKTVCKQSVNQASVNMQDIKKVTFAYPSLILQKRIVAILDEAFAGIDTAIANTEKNLANARELFESYLNLVFSQSGQDWFETTLGKEINLLTGFAFKSKEYTNSTDGISLLRGDNIIQGEFRWQNVKKWPKKDMHIYNKYLLEIGDIVLAMDRTWVKAGLKYAQISEEDVPCLLVQRVARLRAGKNLDSHYLKYLLGSIGFTRYVLSIQTGLGVPHISGKQICDFEFSCPPIEEQKKLANKFDEIEINTKRLTSIYQQKLNSLKELKQSLLQKAFSGELTAKPDKLMDENVA